MCHNQVDLTRPVLNKQQDGTSQTEKALAISIIMKFVSSLKFVSALNWLSAQFSDKNIDWFDVSAVGCDIFGPSFHVFYQRLVSFGL